MRPIVAGAGAAALAIALATSGCGGDKHAAAPTKRAGQALPAADVAVVGTADITRAEFNHWFAVSKKQSRGTSDRTLRNETMDFLISGEWLTQESAARGITATDQEVRTAFEQQKKQSFPSDADYQRFLRTSGQTEQDLLGRVRLSVLTRKLQRDAEKGATTPTPAARQRALNDFAASFERRYRAKTLCRAGFVIDKCRNGPPLKPSTGPTTP